MDARPEWIEGPVARTDFETLLSFAATRASTFSLVVRDPAVLDDHAKRVLDDLSPYKAHEADVSEWPGTRLVGNTARLVHYRVADESIQLLRSASESLYEWVVPSLPEDLCFYRPDGAVLLGSISHEAAAFLDGLTEADKAELMAAGFTFEPWD